MLTTSGLDTATRNALVMRLKSIEGQARGIQHMLEDGRDCQEILDQLTALRAASHVASMQALEAFALHCLRESADAPDEVITQFVGAVAKLTR
ncbi:MAG: metal-sensitive transcriptional regulator [Ktedonobacterales bacterium]